MKTQKPEQPQTAASQQAQTKPTFSRDVEQALYAGDAQWLMNYYGVSSEKELEEVLKQEGL